jgi:hypothetical protein
MLAQGVLPAVRVLSTAILHATLGWLAVAPILTLLLYLTLAEVFRRLSFSTRTSS